MQIHNDISGPWADTIHANNPRSYLPANKTFPVHTTFDWTLGRALQAWDRLKGFSSKRSR